MHYSLKELAQEIKSLQKQLQTKKNRKIPDHPVQYAKENGFLLTSQQETVLNALMEPPYAVLAKAAHNIGKTYVAALFCAWHYERHNPGITLSTAPVHQQVRDLLFKELRKILKSPDWLPKDTRCQSSPEHYIHGFTAIKADAFQGRHHEHMAFVFDEAAGVPVEIWDRMKSMCTFGRKGHYFLGIFNPYDVSCPAYFEEATGKYTCLELSALDHPNVKTGKQVIKSAITRKEINERVLSECRLLENDDELPKAFTWNSKYYVPMNSLFETQVLGRYPSRSTNNVWSQLAIENLCKSQEVGPDWLVQISCDPARFGDDRTAIGVRKGKAVISLETHNGWNLAMTASRLKELCAKYAQKGQTAYQIPVTIDAAGLGAGLIDMKGSGSYRYNWIEVNSACKSRYEGDFVNVRSELWFNAADMAEDGHIFLSNIHADISSQLIKELKSPVFTLDKLQRRVVESKDMTKKRLKQSPDLADAFNLLFHLPSMHSVEKVSARW